MSDRDEIVSILETYDDFTALPETIAEAILGSDWLTAHDVDVAAKALEDAAVDVRAWLGYDLHMTVPTGEPFRVHRSFAWDWLTDRAASIRAAMSHEGEVSDD